MMGSSPPDSQPPRVPGVSRTSLTAVTGTCVCVCVCVHRRRYPYGLLLRWKTGEAVWAEFGAPHDDGPATLFVLKGRDDLRTLTACLCQVYRHLVRSALPVVAS